jgi:hypothetical protein
MNDDIASDREQQSLLGGYGVLVVPPSDSDGGWLVTVAGWDDKAEHYTTSGEGPIFETEDEAMREATRVIVWLRDESTEFNPADAWERMQRARAAEERHDDRPRPWGRF